MMKSSIAAVLLPLVLAWSPAIAAGRADIQPFGPDSLQKIEQTYRGQEFVLVLWSLDCVYCKASLNYLSGESRRRKLDIVTLSTDSADDPGAVAAMRQRLAQAGVRGQAWAFGDVAPEQLRHAIDPRWHGELPRSYWYDASGKRTAYSGVINADVLRRHLPR
ncbi:hypothetical protein [Noviherbaspirillum aridicola]|nr:hypothetical protein [Noviherbaspirillum aridicola]